MFLKKLKKVTKAKKFAFKKKVKIKNHGENVKNGRKTSEKFETEIHVFQKIKYVKKAVKTCKKNKNVTKIQNQGKQEKQG